MNKAVKMIAAIAPLLLGLIPVGCSSSSSNSGDINGTWNASLMNTDGTQAFTFSTGFTQSSNGALTITNFSFNSAGSCFDSRQTTQTGSFGLSGNFNGNVTGTFGMKVSTAISGATTQNVLTLQGTVSGNTISGTWTITGESGCSGNGIFTINKA